MNLYSCLFTNGLLVIFILDRCWSGCLGGYMGDVGIVGFVHSHPVGLVITISIVAAKDNKTNF